MKSEIYWLTRLDYIQDFLMTIVVILIVAMIVFSIIAGVNYEEDPDLYKKGIKWLKTTAITIFIIFAGWVFIPSKDDAIMMIAGDAAYRYIEKDTSMQRIPYNVTKLANEELLKAIKDIELKK